MTLSLGAQQQELPESPQPQTSAESASITGIITDTDGAAVAGASIVLTHPDHPALAAQTAVSAADGGFALNDVAPGAFKLTVTADGFSAQSLSGMLAASQQDALGTIALRGSVNIGVNVVANTHEMAEIEVRNEEKQRIVGFIPNYYIVYGTNVAPLDAKQKYRLAWRTSIDPTSFLFTGVVAGIDQAAGTLSYGPGAEGYWKRFGALYANGFTATILGNAVFPSLLKQDPRYFYKGTGSVRSRAAYAIANAVICKGDNGRWQPAYSGILGSLVAGGISNAYYPAADRGAALTLENTLLNIAGGAASNLFEEFLLKRFTTHSHEKTQP